MTVSDLRLRADDSELWDAAADLESVLDLDGAALDLSPAFRRLLFDLEDALVELVLRGSEARGRARRVALEARAVRAEAAQASQRAKELEIRQPGAPAPGSRMGGAGLEPATPSV